MKKLFLKTRMVIGAAVILLASIAGCSPAISGSMTTTATDTTISSATAEVPGAPPEGGLNGGPGVPGGDPGGGTATVETGSGAYVLADGETLSSGTYTSLNADENAIRAEGVITASLEGVTVEKTNGAASSNDASSFYGLNAAILALDNATLNITGSTVTATAEGANGVFSMSIRPSKLRSAATAEVVP
jgi:hypothetical protein